MVPLSQDVLTASEVQPINDHLGGDLFYRSPEDGCGVGRMKLEDLHVTIDSFSNCLKN